MRAELDKLLKDVLAGLEGTQAVSGLSSVDPQLERTRDAQHGDFTSNVAMRLASKLGRAPREIAAMLTEALPDSPLIESVSVAGPGFINFRLAPEAYLDELRRILDLSERYGLSDTASGKRVLIEYVSANPTGPLHVGHGRHAAYGASLANLLRSVGYEVDEEYYVNDAGRQMEILAASVWLRYAEKLNTAIRFPSNAYQGEYVRDIAATLLQNHADRLLENATEHFAVLTFDDDDQGLDSLIGEIKGCIGERNFRLCLDAALDSVLGDIRDDLEQFGVHHQTWFSERKLSDSSAIDRALDALNEQGLLYEKDGATWFASSRFGDDKDRVVVRENGVRTYFASDIAYHRDKHERGYDLLLNVLGSDHHGYVARVRAGIEALGNNKENLEVRLVQFVVLYRGRVKAQMSTRSGEYVTLRTLRDEVGNDAARFFYVARSNEQHLEFDLELAKSESSDNPVYYIQYAHARIVSMQRRMNETAIEIPEYESTDLSRLSTAEEQGLLSLLSRYPEVVSLAAENRAPQHLAHYLRDLAAAFHSYYNAHKILIDDGGLRDARILLALATQQVLRNALSLLGVSAPESM